MAHYVWKILRQFQPFIHSLYCRMLCEMTVGHSAPVLTAICLGHDSVYRIIYHYIHRQIGRLDLSEATLYSLYG